MRNRRYRILAGTALALILAAPLVGMAKNNSQIAAVPMAAPPAEQAAPESAPATATPATEAPARPTAPRPRRRARSSRLPRLIRWHRSTPPTAPLRRASAASWPPGRTSCSPAGRSAPRSRRSTRTAISRRCGSRRAENARAGSVIARLKDADSDGLEPADYRTPNFAGLAPDALAEAELAHARRLTYARHVQAGRFHYTRMSRNIELPQAAPEPADVLGNVANAADAGQALDRYSPQNEPYRKLKAALAELRGKPAGTKGEASKQIDTIVANMERWRWYPRDLGNSHILVNQPDFTLKVMHNGGQVWTTRIVIGKPSMATPLLSETMKFITVNPTWTVPQSIVRNEYPGAGAGPDGARAHGLARELQRRRRDDHAAARRRNALGRVRFNFNNLFGLPARHAGQAVLLHDVRAYSHGCMRVQDPAKYAEVLLNIARPNERWTAERVTRMYGGAEQNLQLSRPRSGSTCFRPPSSTTPASCRCGATSTISTAARSPPSAASGNLEPAPVRKRDEIAGSSPRKPAALARTGALPQPIYR